MLIVMWIIGVGQLIYEVDLFKLGVYVLITFIVFKLGVYVLITFIVLGLSVFFVRSNPIDHNSKE